MNGNSVNNNPFNYQNYYDPTQSHSHLNKRMHLETLEFNDPDLVDQPHDNQHVPDDPADLYQIIQNQSIQITELSAQIEFLTSKTQQKTQKIHHLKQELNNKIQENFVLEKLLKMGWNEKERVKNLQANKGAVLKALGVVDLNIKDMKMKIEKSEIEVKILNDLLTGMDCISIVEDELV